MIEEKTFFSIDRALVWLQMQVSQGFCWYRGHTNAEYKLVPKVFRPDCTKTENNLYRGFIREAYSLLGNHAPNDLYSIDWLPLMQHYGLATRALDWTTTPLTALFFSVSNETDDTVGHEQDGTVWLLNPTRLNELCWPNGGGIIRNDAPFMRLHMLQAISQGCLPPPKAVAFQSLRRTVRERAQHGAFTIHSGSLPLEQLAESETFLKKIRIPNHKKLFFKELLFTCGIDAASMFAELPHVAQRLMLRTKNSAR